MYYFLPFPIILDVQTCRFQVGSFNYDTSKMVFQDEFIADQEQIRSVLDYDITIRELPPDYSYYVALTGTSQCSKIGKKCNFKSTKTHFLLFQKWQKKSIFAQEESLKLPKMQFLDFFLVQKLIFAIFENANNVFLYF